MIDTFINAAKEGLTEDIEQLLKEQPDLLHATRENGESPLLAALYHGKQNVVQQLLSFGVAISIHEAAAIGDMETVEFLLKEHKVSISEHSFDGWTPLHLASFFGNYEMSKFLIEQGADVNARSLNKLTNMPIHAAVAGRKYPLVQLLLENKADPNVQQQDGWTPLHQSVSNFDIQMTELLLNNGANVRISLENGRTPLDIAEEKEFEDILTLLKQTLKCRQSDQ